MNETEKVLGVAFVSYDESSKILEPSNQAFNFPPSLNSTKWATILRLASGLSIRCDHVHAVLLLELGIQRVAIVGFVTDESLWKLLGCTCIASAER